MCFLHICRVVTDVHGQDLRKTRCTYRDDGNMCMPREDTTHMRVKQFLPSCANLCIFRKLYLRSNLSNKSITLRSACFDLFRVKLAPHNKPSCRAMCHIVCKLGCKSTTINGSSSFGTRCLKNITDALQHMINVSI